MPSRLPSRGGSCRGCRSCLPKKHGRGFHAQETIQPCRAPRHKCSRANCRGRHELDLARTGGSRLWGGWSDRGGKQRWKAYRTTDCGSGEFRPILLPRKREQFPISGLNYAAKLRLRPPGISPLTAVMFANGRNLTLSAARQPRPSAAPEPLHARAANRVDASWKSRPVRFSEIESTIGFNTSCALARSPSSARSRARSRPARKR